MYNNETNNYWSDTFEYSYPNSFAGRTKDYLKVPLPKDTLEYNEQKTAINFSVTFTNSIIEEAGYDKYVYIVDVLNFRLEYVYSTQMSSTTNTLNLSITSEEVNKYLVDGNFYVQLTAVSKENTEQENIIIFSNEDYWVEIDI